MGNMLAEQISTTKELLVTSEACGSIISPQSEARVTATAANERRHTEFFDVIAASLKINTPEDFCTWTGGSLQHIFLHSMLICGVGKLQKQSADIQNLLTCNFTSDYI